jgi:hypothetical protein
MGSLAVDLHLHALPFRIHLKGAVCVQHEFQGFDSLILRSDEAVEPGDSPVAKNAARRTQEAGIETSVPFTFPTSVRA